MDLLDRLTPALAASYRIERELGAGGMAKVYLARDLRHDREVAIKVLLPEIAAALSHERFLQEIQIAAQLQHPLILPLFDSGQADGLYYYVMPRIVGESLRQRLEREKTIPVEEAVQIAREVAEALHHAHEMGVVHRDIKPENIMLSGGHSLVADFGIARALGPSTAPRLTSTGIMVGTPYYMSPEQAVGDPNLDGRSDVYSLGCVLWEMLIGTPPYTGASLYAIVSGHVAGASPTLSTKGKTLSPGLRATLESALAKDPAQRFASAGDLARALADTTKVKRRRTRPVALQQTVLAMLAAVAITVGGYSAWSIVRGDPSLDPNLVAVAPFDAIGTGLEIWREGVMDMLSRNLDGAGPLRVVSPSVVLRHWTGRADVASAQEVGRKTGAGLSVVGSIMPAGTDSVRLTVSLVDVATSEALGEVEFRGNVNRIDLAVDSLTMRLLAAVSRNRAEIGATRLSAGRSSSFPALKAYLEGEQYFRRADWDSANIHFERAAAIDSSFTLAWYRIFQSRLYKGTGLDSLMWSYALRAGALNRGLSPRDSLLVAADSVLAAVSEASALDPVAQQQRRRVLDILELANRRFPDDAEVWYNLGRARHRIGYLAGVSPELALEPLEQAIRLDSTFAPAYVEAISFATLAADQATTERLLAGYLALKPKGMMADVAGLALALMQPRRAGSEAVARVLDTASARVLYHTLSIFEHAADSAETSIRIGRHLVERGHDPSLAADPALPRRALGFALAFRGHFTEAMSILGTDRLYLVSQMAVLGGVPAGTAATVFNAALRGRPPVHEDIAFTLPWFAEVRDTAALKAAIGIGSQDSNDMPAARFVVDAGQAWLALARGDTVEGRRRFLELPDLTNQQGVGDWERYVAIRLLNDAGRHGEALARLDREIQSTPFPWDVVLLLERGRANEGLNQVARAVEAYDRVAAIWLLAEPALQPSVESARTAADRLRSAVSR